MNINAINNIIGKAKVTGSVFSGRIENIQDLQDIIFRYKSLNDNPVCFCICKQIFLTRLTLLIDGKTKTENSIWDHTITLQGITLNFIVCNQISKTIFMPSNFKEPNYNTIIIT